MLKENKVGLFGDFFDQTTIFQKVMAYLKEDAMPLSTYVQIASDQIFQMRYVPVDDSACLVNESSRRIFSSSLHRIFAINKVYHHYQEDNELQ